MIEFDENLKTYVCPYCGCKQSFEGSCEKLIAIDALENYSKGYIVSKDACVSMYILECLNKCCGEITLVAWNEVTKKQYDILPRVTFKHFPDYIPQQIRADYEEGSVILQDSPKAAATLFRRCLQGMIHDFWSIKEKNLNAEITQLKDRIDARQWKALDGLRKIGNIGAHMESDVNLIVDVKADEAEKLQKMIELLFKQWYINRQEREQLYAEIVQTSENKEQQRKNEK